jgi:hypothetical protein
VPTLFFPLSFPSSSQPFFLSPILVRLPCEFYAIPVGIFGVLMWFNVRQAGVTLPLMHHP